MDEVEPGAASEGSGPPRRTTCAVVGGGPAGLVLGLRLARAGLAVTVLEKHGDFLRDFRGDTVHPSTMTLLDELGLWEEFAQLPWKPLNDVALQLDAGTVPVGDLSGLRVPHPFIAMVPQWHLLDLLARAADREPGFTLLRHAEGRELLRADDGPDGRTVGVRWRDRTPGGNSGDDGDGGDDGNGGEHDLAADLVVACDGRDSRLRAASGLPVREYRVPIDAWWLRLSRRDDDPNPGISIRRTDDGRMMIMLDRGDHYQIAHPIPKGSDAELRAGSVSTLRAQLRALHPWLGDRVDEIGSWDDVALLRVQLSHLRRWSAPGLLCLGDAAHAMSPMGGIGINLAVQDAVAAARLLAGPLADGDPAAVDRAARAVQRRRSWPAVATQTLQRAMHGAAGSVPLPRDPAADPAPSDAPRPAAVPPPLRLLRRFAPLRRLPAAVIGIGFRPEHAPDFARRPATSARA